MMAWREFSKEEQLRTRSAGKRAMPSYATSVLRQALRRADLDWPEKIMQTYMVHCEDYEDVDELQHAVVEAKKASKAIAKRREREAAEAAAAAQQYQQSQPQDIIPTTEVVAESSSSGKRKRDDEVNGAAIKRTKGDGSPVEEPQVQPQSVSAPSLAKRDRENATVIVKNLPPTVTETRVRQFFRDCGKINTLKLLPDDNGRSTSATIEFEEKEDVVTAQTREGRELDGYEIRIQVGSGTTLYVTNFPPTADEAYIRNLFSQVRTSILCFPVVPMLTVSQYGEIIDVRFPSLKYKTHRRFCYVQFRTSDQAHAATEKDGSKVETGLTLLAKISDPTAKKDREGAMYEGREIFMLNVHFKATEDEIRDLFSKFGTVERVRLPQKAAGQSKGIAYVVFSSKVSS